MTESVLASDSIHIKLQDLHINGGQRVREGVSDGVCF